MSQQIKDFGSMTVKEAYRIVTKLMQEGQGELPLVAVDSRSGLSSACRINSKVSVVEENEGIGCLEEAIPGTKYILVSLSS